MDRRTFNKLAGLAAMGAMADKSELHAQSVNASAPASRASAKEVMLEDSDLLVAFDKTTGALTRLERKSTGWRIHRRPELGISFRLLVPMPRQRANFVLGQKQHATRVEKTSNSKVEIVWKD